MKNHKMLTVLAGVGLALCGVVLLGPGLAERVAYAAAKGENEADQESLAGMAQAEQLSKLFRQVAKVVKPAVVEVRVTHKARAAGQRPEFHDFFPGLPPGMSPPRREMPRRGGLGSGVIVDAEGGYVLTNAHVVNGADKVVVVLQDDRKLEAEWVRQDTKTDLAVVRIKPDKLISVKLGDSDRIEVGDWVLAIGSPAGLEQTVTAGIISAKGRRTRLGAFKGHYENYLQTDAAINRGNSGGPLVNMRGEMIGVNTAIITPGGAGQSAGIGLSIPSNLVKFVMRKLIDTGSVSRGFLGIEFKDTEQGLTVSTVVDGLPGAEGGLRVRDVIIELDGKELEDGEDFRWQIAEMDPGTTHELTVLRKGEKVTLTVTLGKQPDDLAAAMGLRGRPGPGRSGTAEKLGLQVADLTPQLAQRYGYPARTAGVVIVRVRTPNLLSRRLRPGVLIRKVGDVAVDTADQFVAAIDQADLGEGIELRIEGPDGSGMSLLLTEPEENPDDE